MKTTTISELCSTVETIKPKTAFGISGPAVSPAAEPLSFYPSQIEKGRRDNVLCYDPLTQTFSNLNNVLLHDYSEESPGGDNFLDQAYWPHPYKRKAKTLTGYIEFCALLTRYNYSDNDDERVIFQFTDDIVAIKVIYWDEQLLQLENPLSQIAVMQQLGKEPPHPNLVGCLEVLSDTCKIPSTATTASEARLLWRVNIIMPYCNGGDLFDLVQSTPRGRVPSGSVGLTENAARVHFLQIIAGLRHLHSIGICHRDITPENIMIHNEECRVIDFGMCLRMPYMGPGNHNAATDVTRGTQLRLMTPQGAVGKLPYMPPEIYRSEQPFDGCAADVWMAGTTLFYMISGKAPYEMPFDTDVLFVMLTENLNEMLEAYGVTLSKEGLNLLQHLLQVDPALRLSITEIENHPWCIGPDEKG